MLKFGTTEINSWTKFELNQDMTLEKFIDLYEDKFKTKISMVCMEHQLYLLNLFLLMTRAN